MHRHHGAGIPRQIRFPTRATFQHLLPSPSHPHRTRGEAKAIFASHRRRGTPRTDSVPGSRGTHGPASHVKSRVWRGRPRPRLRQETRNVPNLALRNATESFSPEEHTMESTLRPTFVSIALILLCCMAMPGLSPAQNASSAAQPAVPAPRARIGLALSGGGALGLAEIGVIQWMEENHIPVDRIAGTSMGGIIGAMYATGMSPAEIQKFAQA